MSELIEAGAHFGHKTKRWNPKMAPYLFGVRNGLHIIDLQQTVPLLYRALVAVREVVAKNGRVLFVGTKRQAADPVAEAARACGQYYINQRWLGGMLTNWGTIQASIKRLRKLEELLAQEETGLTKKEVLTLTHDHEKLERSLGGIKDMGGLPDLIFIIDTNKEDLAVKEAARLNIPVIAILDSNSSPEFITQENHKIEDYNGGVARRDIIAGEPVSSASIVTANEGGFMSAVLTPGKRAISIAVNSTSGNAGFIFPGDKVDLILTHKLAEGTLASETFVEDVRVLAIDQMLNNPDNKAVIAKTITLEVSPKQAEMINVAISIGSISVSLRSLAQGTNDTKPKMDNTSETDKTAVPDSTNNYSTNNDVSKLMGDKSSGSKVSVYHGSANEQLDFHEGKK